ncbi:Transketolase, thiamine diphosphate binding domain-containing protein [Thelonectria olida]|uniref:Transketolase, thiamine diphosphate binding domain-containing protein n=1 Tax=Thelonectria olida TaxID=1576542 RepID=A0A9P9AM87_9HYPO|nr:Transketolase, thiamine diphosphate binding domain-containing protein [Thelonectria olida]
MTATNTALGNARKLTPDGIAVRDVRKLVIDCCRQNGGGHGGSAIGMAPLGVALWRHTLRFSTQNPEWFDRDRFVLSNGHAAIFLYTMLHVAGYPHMTLDELKMYADPKAFNRKTGTWKSTICHGHPEIEVPGIEVTTGPLGQGIANAVGLAIASKHLAATFNKPGYNMIQSRIYCSTGDGCLQEGVAMEAMAIAGHLKLDNLVLCYDNNQVTCDGPLEWIVSEDINSKMRSIGWNVIDVFEGDTSVESIVSALNLGNATKGMPTFINIRSTIGYGTSTAGTAKSHHGTYTDADATLYSESSDQVTHRVSKECKEYFAEWADQGNRRQVLWNEKLHRYCQDFPEDGKLLRARITGEINYQDVLSRVQLPPEPASARSLNGAVFQQLIDHIPNFIAGGADLWTSNQMGDHSHRIFDGSQPEGRVIRYGIREHAMAAISNGLAAYSPNTIIPITATFFMFYLYAAPGVRMGALSSLKVIHVATHDSIGEGQNGPTHQPVEVDSLYRAMPNLLYIRPADGEEIIGAWSTALEIQGQSAIISLARDPPAIAIPNTSRDKISKGGYVIVHHPKPVVTLVSCGSELQFAVTAAAKLTEEGIGTRVVSMPCLRVFEAQSAEYQESVLSDAPHVISVEAYVPGFWARICTASIGMNSFGYSGAGRDNFSRFGIDAEGVVAKVKAHIGSVGSGHASRRWKLLT